MSANGARPVRSVGEAVARIAFATSDVILSVQPALAQDSEFSPHLRSLAEQQHRSLVAGGSPEVLPLRYNADPLLSAFEPLRKGKFVAITTGTGVLLPSVPHLYKLAQYPVVIHAALNDSPYPDFSEIAAIRQSGFIFLQSETLQEAQDIALTAHALAIKSGKGVIHFFDPQNAANDDPIPVERMQDVQELIDRGAVQAFRRHSPASSTLYADDGRQATVTELQDPPADGAAPVVNGVNGTTSGPPKGSPERQVGQNEKGSSIGSTPRPGSVDSHASASSATTADTWITRAVSSEDIIGFVQDIWTGLESAVGRSYRAFEVTSASDKPSAALFVFGSTGIFADELRTEQDNPDYQDLAVVTARLYRPWIGTDLQEVLPSSVKRIAVLEQLRRKTTKWGPALLDILSSVQPQSTGQTIIVGHQLGYLERATVGQALRGILHNLKSPKPIQNLEIGTSRAATKPQESLSTLSQPKIENAYMKILDQVFGKRLHVANSLHDANAGVSQSLASNPEYGFGSLIARMERRQRFVGTAQAASQSNSFATEAPAKWLSQWCLVADNSQKANDIAPDLIERLKVDGSRLASDLLDSSSFFFKESQWIIGSDAWAYDLANSGVHHVIASDANVNMLIIDSQPYSERAVGDASRRKKDIGLYAMNFGNAYVASVAVYGSYTQVLEAIIEADRFPGPSVVVAYLPYNKEDDSPVTVLQETKKAVDLGYWPLYRWNPNNEEKGLPNFQLDSERMKKELEAFLARDNKLTQLMQRHPTFAANLSGSYGTEVRDLQKKNARAAYQRLVESLYGAPMTVLYASDNGNAEGLAKRLANRGKARGLKSIVMAMDDYPIDDLATEENVVFITSTAGQGEFPQNGRALWEGLKGTGDLDLSNVHIAVFSLGDSHYWPRKEDKAYYNKPGRDLDARLEFLGAKKHTELGQGDDQDPDGYQTGYAEWEPKLWKALGVDKVEGLPEEPPPLTNEDIKIESNYLRGTIAEGLEDTSTGAISAADSQLTKFHGTYQQDDRDLRDERKSQGLEPAYIFMIRCRLNGGVASPSQYLQMDAISDSFGNHTMKLTTRQTFQFHGVIKGKLKSAMRGINKALMTTLAACGDVNRNVMVSVLPRRNQLHEQVQEVSARIAKHLLPQTAAYHEVWIMDENDKKQLVSADAMVEQEPMYGPTYLPRKFKITIAIPPHNDTDVYAHDVGMIAIVSDDGHLLGFNFLAGGGMGVTHNNKKTYPRTGSMLGYAAAEHAHLVCEKIMLVQRDHGDRLNRKHARLKYTMDDMGADVFRSKVEERLGFGFESAKPFHFDSNVDSYGWHRDETGLNHFLLFVENGRVENTPDFAMKTGLRAVAALLHDKGAGEFRLSPNQHLCISNVPDALLPELKALLASYGLDNLAHSRLRLTASACVAFPTCGLAMAESERYLPKLVTLLEPVLQKLGLEQDSIVLRMTGCPNGCARPWVAEVALVGKSYGVYNLYLGGGFHGQRLNKLYRSNVEEKEILEILEGLLTRWKEERTRSEPFGDFLIRVGVINETTEGKYFHDGVAEEDEEDE